MSARTTRVVFAVALPVFLILCIGFPLVIVTGWGG